MKTISLKELGMFDNCCGKLDDGMKASDFMKQFEVSQDEWDKACNNGGTNEYGTLDIILEFKCEDGEFYDFCLEISNITGEEVITHSSVQISDNYTEPKTIQIMDSPGKFERGTSGVWDWVVESNCYYKEVDNDKVIDSLNWIIEDLDEDSTVWNLEGSDSEEEIEVNKVISDWLG